MNKREIYDYLNVNGIEYEISEHTAVYNMAELAEIDIPYPEADAKNLFVRDDKKQNYYLITVKGDKRVDLKDFRKKQNLRSLSFASADDLMAYMGLTPGSVTPLALLNDSNHRVHFYIDRGFTGGIIGVHPNDNTATVWLRTDDLIRLIRNNGNEVRIVEL